MAVLPFWCAAATSSVATIEMMIRQIAVSSLVLSTIVLPAFAAKEARSASAKRLDESASVLREVMSAKDRGIPQDLLDKAACIVIVPGVKKAAFILGGKYGRGFVMCRNSNGVGWSAPGAVRVEGGSVGFQIGASDSDVIMLVLNQRGAEKLLSSKFTVGADASAAVGPVGRMAAADTDAYMRAEILTWSRSHGVFAGISLNGATLRDDSDANQELYGKAITNKQIVFEKAAAPPTAKRLLAELNRYSSRK